MKNSTVGIQLLRAIPRLVSDLVSGLLSGLMMSVSMGTFLGLVATTAFAQDDACREWSRYQDVSTQEAAKLVAEHGALFIDVNGKESYSKMHVPGALHYQASQAKLGSLLPAKKDALIVAYCGNEKCTAWRSAAEAACHLGYTNIRHMPAGIAGWSAQVEHGKSG